MNETLTQMKNMKRAMRPFVLTLYELALELPEGTDLLEIGVRQYQSTRALISALVDKKSGTLTSIDVVDYPSRLKEGQDRHRFILADSHADSTHDLVSDRKYGLLLIDGDHRYEGARKDWELYYDLVSPGGYIIFHDVLNEDCGVPKLWEEVKAYCRMGNQEYLTIPTWPGMGIIRV